MNEFVCARRDDVFLDQHLDAVGHRLQKTKWSNTIGAVTILNPTENLPLQHRHKCEQAQKYCEECENIDQTRRNLNNPARGGRQPRQQPMLYINKDLIGKLAHVAMKKTVN